MTVKLNAQKLLYVSIPKCASTSLKHLFYRFQYGHDFVPGSINSKGQIHTLYPARPRAALIDSHLGDYFKVTVVRDPIKRLISAYTNKVVNQQLLDQGGSPVILADAGLSTRPDLDAFVEHLELYQAASLAILGHTRPAVDFIGHDPSFFDRIYALSELTTLVSDLEARLGTQLVLGQHQTSGTRWHPDDLSAAHRAKLMRYYEADYAAYADYF